MDKYCTECLIWVHLMYLRLLSSIGVYIIYPIINNYLKLVVLSFEDDVKHPDRESNSAANKVYLTV